MNSPKHFFELDLKMKIPNENIILAVYFNKYKDPQRGNYVNGNDINYILPWYSSIIEKKMYGIIFHDHLNDEFIQKYENEYVKFIYIDHQYLTLDNYYDTEFPEEKKNRLYSKTQRLNTNNNASINDFRFVVYYNFIRQNPDLKYVFCTDVSDIWFVNNFNSYLKPNIFYSGEIPKYNVIGQCGCSGNRKYKGHKKGNFISCSWEKSGKYHYFLPINYIENLKKHGDNVLLAAGLFGGEYNIMINVLREMCKNFSIISTTENINMFMLNYVAYTLKNTLNYTIQTGRPLHNDFGMKSDERNENYDEVWVKHRNI
jgi:hypothetical protein